MHTKSVWWGGIRCATPFSCFVSEIMNKVLETWMRVAVSCTHFCSAKFRLWSDLKPQAVPGFWFSLSKGSKIKCLICWLKKLLILVGGFAIAATGKIQKRQDMACGVVGGGEHKQDQIGTDCKGITQWRTHWDTLTSCLWCLFEWKRVWSIQIVPSITDAGWFSAALSQSGI